MRTVILRLIILLALTACTDTVPEDRGDVWGVQPAQTAQAAREIGEAGDSSAVTAGGECVP